MTERELKLLLDAHAIKQVQVHYAVMAHGYMIVVDGKPLETGKKETRQFKTLDAAAKLLALRRFHTEDRDGRFP